jgi:hypothetical protein
VGAVSVIARLYHKTWISRQSGEASGAGANVEEQNYLENRLQKGISADSATAKLSSRPK